MTSKFAILPHFQAALANFGISPITPHVLPCNESGGDTFGCLRGTNTHIFIVQGSHRAGNRKLRQLEDSKCAFGHNFDASPLFLPIIAMVLPCTR